MAKQDFIDGFLEWSENTPSPPIFRLWSAITCIAGALERRVWVKALSKPTYANLFTLLVASPGVGKGIIDDAHWLWSEVKKLHIAPDSTSAASMLDSLGEAKRIFMNGSALPYEYHSLAVAAEEFGVFLPSHDNEFLSRLNTIFTNPERAFRVRRKYIKEEISILRPNITILAGSQPGYLMSLLPEEAWVMGFTQRLLLVHASEGPSPELFTEEPDREDRGLALVSAIREMTDLYGLVPWEPAAADFLRQWDLAGGPPKPKHIRLMHYCKRRTQFMLKLMLISAISRRQPPTVIVPFDFTRALMWLTNAEKTMPDVFREMTAKSDTYILQELLQHVFLIYIKDKKPVHRSRCMYFLSERAPSERVPKLLEVAEQSGFLTRVEGDCYIPRRDPGQELQ